MFEGDYSKKVWIITIVMAIGSLVMDIFFLMKGDTLMRDTVWITMPIAVCGYTLRFHMHTPE